VVRPPDAAPHVMNSPHQDPCPPRPAGAARRVPGAVAGLLRRAAGRHLRRAGRRTQGSGHCPHPPTHTTTQVWGALVHQGVGGGGSDHWGGGGRGVRKNHPHADKPPHFLTSFADGQLPSLPCLETPGARGEGHRRFFEGMRIGLSHTRDFIRTGEWIPDPVGAPAAPCPRGSPSAAVGTCDGSTGCCCGPRLPRRCRPSPPTYYPRL